MAVHFKAAEAVFGKLYARCADRKCINGERCNGKPSGVRIRLVGLSQTCNRVYYHQVHRFPGWTDNNHALRPIIKRPTEKSFMDDFHVAPSGSDVMAFSSIYYHSNIKLPKELVKLICAYLPYDQETPSCCL